MIIPTPDTSREQRYRSHFLRRDEISFSLFAGLVILFNVLLFKADARLWPTGPVHDGLVALRWCIISCSTLTIAAAFRAKSPEVFDRWTLGWGIMLALTNNLVILSRPADYTGNVMPEIIAVVCLFAIMPDRPGYRLLPSFVMAAGSLLLLFTVKQLPGQVALLSLLFSYITALSMGFWISRTFFKYRREAFYAKEELETAHHETRLSEQQYRFLVQNNHGVIFIIQADGVISFASSSWTRKLGHSVEHVVGHDYREFLHHDDISLCEEFLQYSLTVGGVHESVRYRAVHADGTFRWYQTTIMACYDEQQTITSFIGNGIDVNEQVLAEMELRRARDEAEAANKAKSEFLALVSHEIRTPLNALVGFSSLARKTSDPEKLRQYHEILEHSSSSLMDLVNDILDMSKIEADRITLESMPFSLGRLLADLEQQYRSQAEQKQLQFYLIIDPDLPDWISGDPVRIRQILGNLLSNAVKFTEQGSISCTLNITGKDAEGLPLLSIAVQDSGIGIPTEKQNLLFKPFQQLDSSITRKFGGTGLGLAIVAGLVRMMAGSISIDSNEGIGTTIRVLLPFCSAKAPLEEFAIPLTVAEAASILVVEDNTFNRLLMEEILTSWNHRVSLAENGEQGLQMMETQRFDLLLLDIRMPGIDGIEVARQLRQKEVQRNEQPMPVIAITADADAATRVACIAVGINEVLAKPVSPARLAEAIADQCGIAVTPEEDWQPVLTAKALAGLGSTPERARQYLAILMQDISENLDGLQEAFSRNDREELRLRAHTLKGLYVQLENSVPAKLAAWLQHNAATASREQLLQHLNQLQRETSQELSGTDKEVKEVTV